MRNRRLWYVVIGVAVSAGVGVYLSLPRLLANMVFRDSQRAAARHDYREAAKHIQAYLKARPNDWQGWLFAAQLARQMGDLSKAAMFQREAEKLGASASALAIERSLLPIQQGDLRHVDKLLSQGTDSARAPNEAALILQAVAEGSLRAGDVRLARLAAQAWLKARPGVDDQVIGHVWLGEAAKQANEIDQTIDNFQRAVDLDPDHLRARILLAATLLHDQPEKARPHLELLRRTHPNDLEVLFQSARLQHHLGHIEEACDLLDQVLVAGDLVPALVERGRIALELLQPEKAESYLRRAVALSADHRLANVTLADCLRQLGKADEAGTYLARVQEMDEKKHRAAKD